MTAEAEAAEKRLAERKARGQLSKAEIAGVGHVVCTLGNYEAKLYGDANEQGAKVVIQAWTTDVFKGATFGIDFRKGWRETNVLEVAQLFGVELSPAAIRRAMRMNTPPAEPKAKAKIATSIAQVIETADVVITTKLEPVVAPPPVKHAPAFRGRTANALECTRADCSVPVHAKGLCPVHYREARKPAEAMKHAA